jgi:hypothetical protein
MDYKKWERRLIKWGMGVALVLALLLYFLSKKWMMTAAPMPTAEYGPPPPMELYRAHKQELLLWYDKFVIPFVLPAFLYWFHKFIDARYAKRQPIPVEEESNV